MKDQELMTDLLLAEKKMSENYNTFASECVSPRLRDTFVELLTEGHRAQTQMFDTARQKGWYQVEQAETQKVNQACQKFTNQLSELG